MGSYRFDSRSEDQFKKDIKDSTMTERNLFLSWLNLVKKETGKRPKYKDTGCGKDGEFLEDNQVSADPDFYVEGYGSIEVKFSKPTLDKFFHLKKSQVKKYLEKQTTILMFNGTEGKCPQFTMLKPDTLKRICSDCEVVKWMGFGGKESYRIPINMFIWRPLK